MEEKIIARIDSDEEIGCCGGHTYNLISVNGGYTTECTCGMWCGQWHEDPISAIEYFKNMVHEYWKEERK